MITEQYLTHNSGIDTVHIKEESNTDSDWPKKKKKKKKKLAVKHYQAALQFNNMKKHDYSV